MDIETAEKLRSGDNVQLKRNFFPDWKSDTDYEVVGIEIIPNDNYQYDNVILVITDGKKTTTSSRCWLK